MQPRAFSKRFFGCGYAALCGAGLHPAGRFSTGLFVLSSPAREAPLKSARSKVASLFGNT
jgi:hypothetical protein